MAAHDWPPLVDKADLEGQPGAPFTDAQVKTATDVVRAAAGWHIAPEVTETLTLDHDGSRLLVLPSLHVVDVAAVRDITGSTPRDLTGWRWSGAGMIEGRFPAGFRAVEVELTHGYATVPDALLGVIAGATSGRIRSHQAGPFQVTFADEQGATNPQAVLARYTLPSRP